MSKNTKIAQKLRKILSNPLQFFQNTIVLLCNYLIYSKIKFLFFLLKSVAIIKKSGIFAMSNNNNNNNKNKETMTNTEIRIEAQRIFRQLVIATHNDAYGEDDGSMNILNIRMIKAIRWAKENGEFDTLRYVCTNMFKGGISGMGFYANQCLSLFEM